jgi:alpha-L-rhamnosidase
MANRMRDMGWALAGAAVALVVASPAWAAAPKAPLNLRIDDQARPLSVEGAPRFGWLPQDDDGGEIQTAYEIEVRDASGKTVWSSGKVASGQQSYVPYAGPALAPGRAYDWRVRTWDRGGQASPWSAAAAFDTGLGDRDWGAARWIRREPGQPGVAGPMRVEDGRVTVRGGNSTLLKTGQAWTDYTVEARVTPRTGGGALVFRAANANSGYAWQLLPGVGLRTQALAGRMPTTLRDVTLPVAADRTYAVKIEARGQTIRTFIDGALVDEQTDARFAAGTVGVRQGPRDVAEFDDIKVTGADGKVLAADDFSGGLGQWAAPVQEADEYTLARTETVLPAGKIVRARSYMAASHTAELFINGKRADRMSNFNHPGEGYYQAADITPLVEAGKPLAVGALLHWYSGGQGRATGVPGLLVRVVVDYADGRQAVVVSDGSWKVTRGPYIQVGTRNGEGEYIEHLDGMAVKAIGDWTARGYDAAGWSPAVVIGAHPAEPFTHLSGLQTRVAETIVHPVRMLKAADGTPVADFGVIMPVRPRVHFDQGVAGREVTLRASYLLKPDGRVATDSVATQGTDMRLIYTQSAGPQDYNVLTHMGMRYLEIPGAGEDIALEDVSAVLVHTDYSDGQAATFDSFDATLNGVWELMKRSLAYSVQETFVDTSTREKGQFLADSIGISYGLMASEGERLHSRQAIREFLLSQKRYWNSGNDAGRYNAVYPNVDGKRDIPDFTLLVPDWIWRYYQETGDKALLEETWPAIAATADYVRRNIAAGGPTEGLVTRLPGGSGAYVYGIVDWPSSGRFDYDMSAAARTTVNALGVHVLRTVALAARELGKPAAPFTADADALAARMNATLRRPDGVYVDGLSEAGAQSAHAGQHSTSYALAFGIAPAADRDKLADYVASMGMKQGPMTAHWMLTALAAAGDEDQVLKRLTDRTDLGWAKVVAEGGTFTPEAWVPDNSANSLSHGWGSQSIVDLQGSILGLSVVEPGASVVRIAVPDSGLEHAAGLLPTQRGPVSTDWTKAGGKVTLKATVPVNVEAIIELPAGAYRVTAPGGAAARAVEGGQGVTRYRVGSGTWVFTAR